MLSSYANCTTDFNIRETQVKSVITLCCVCSYKSKSSKIISKLRNKKYKTHKESSSHFICHGIVKGCC